MAQPTLNRLLIIPAIILAASLSLTGCSNLPFFGGDSGSSNNSSSKDDDKDDDEDDDEEEEEEDNDDDASGNGSCPQKLLDTTLNQSAVGEVGLDDLALTEISQSDFKPEVVGPLLEDGCLISITYSAEGEEGTLYEAFVPGGAELQAELDAALVADGWDNSTEGFYLLGETYVVVTSAAESGMTPESLDEQGLGFLGDDFLIVVAYSA